MAPRRRPNQERSRQTVIAILEAAIDVFGQHGYAGATTNKIAHRAGVSIGSLYQYFPNKDAVLVRLYEDHFEMVRQMVAGVLDDFRDSALPMPEVIRGIFTRAIDLQKSSPRLFRVVNLAPQVRSLLEAERMHKNLWVEAAADGISVRNGRPREENHVAALLLVMTTQTIGRWLIHADAEDAERASVAEETVEMLAEYLAGHGCR
jgi:AcrR family transcriptional regulator